jgi:hypothetical protein
MLITALLFCGRWGTLMVQAAEELKELEIKEFFQLQEPEVKQYTLDRQAY